MFGVSYLLAVEVHLDGDHLGRCQQVGPRLRRGGYCHVPRNGKIIKNSSILNKATSEETAGRSKSGYPTNRFIIFGIFQASRGRSSISPVAAILPHLCEAMMEGESQLPTASNAGHTARDSADPPVSRKRQTTTNNSSAAPKTRAPQPRSNRQPASNLQSFPQGSSSPNNLSSQPRNILPAGLHPGFTTSNALLPSQIAQLIPPASLASLAPYMLAPQPNSHDENGRQRTSADQAPGALGSPSLNNYFPSHRTATPTDPRPTNPFSNNNNSGSNNTHYNFPGIATGLTNGGSSPNGPVLFSPTFQCFTSFPLYAALLLELQTLALLIDQREPEARAAVWAQLFALIGIGGHSRLGPRVSDENVMKTPYGIDGQPENSMTARFTPIIEQWLESKTLNLLAVELLYLSFSLSILQYQDLLGEDRAYQQAFLQVTELCKPMLSDGAGMDGSSSRAGTEVPSGATLDRTETRANNLPYDNFTPEIPQVPPQPRSAFKPLSSNATQQSPKLPTISATANLPHIAPAPTPSVPIPPMGVHIPSPVKAAAQSMPPSKPSRIAPSLPSSSKRPFSAVAASTSQQDATEAGTQPQPPHKQGRGAAKSATSSLSSNIPSAGTLTNVVSLRLPPGSQNAPPRTPAPIPTPQTPSLRTQKPLQAKPLAQSPSFHSPPSPSSARRAPQSQSGQIDDKYAAAVQQLDFVC
jgi:hypothetical protein